MKVEWVFFNQAGGGIEGDELFGGLPHFPPPHHPEVSVGLGLRRKGFLLVLPPLGFSRSTLMGCTSVQDVGDGKPSSSTPGRLGV